MKKALAFSFDEEQRLYCCACAAQIIAEPGFLWHLYLATTKLKKIDADALCPRCGYRYGGHDAQMAAERISMRRCKR